MTEYDYVVVGAGSAGCVVAARLSEDASCRVLLLEAGGPDRSLYIRIPAGAATFHGGPNPHNWYGFTEPQPALEGRRMYWPTGKGWGGTSSINGMAYVRGHALDYDGWAAMGLADWSYERVLPYFLKAEHNERGRSHYHGDAGPLRVSDIPTWQPLSDAFVRAGEAAGYPLTDDFNGAQQEGFGRLQLTTHNGLRWSTATGYLRPALRRRNLAVVSHALVSRFTMQGERVVGVEWLHEGQCQSARASREVILCAGVTRTPQILMLSGIGDAAALSKLGIDVVADRPEVGRNLQDHVSVQLKWTCPEPVTLYSQRQLLTALRTALQYFLFRRGVAQGAGVEANAFLSSRHGLTHPDLQFAMVNVLMEGEGLKGLQVTRHGFTISVWHLRPDSRGHIALSSADPAEHPLVQPNYFSKATEAVALREAVKIARHVIAQAPFDRYRGEELVPGPGVQSDVDIDAFLRRSATGLFHPVGSARMGVDDAAVVDAQLRVRGVQGLRIADASVMPRIVSGNTNAAVIMIAEKAADLIRGRQPL
jgi:choline dehydrogenase